MLKIGYFLCRFCVDVGYFLIRDIFITKDDILCFARMASSRSRIKYLTWLLEKVKNGCDNSLEQKHHHINTCYDYSAPKKCAGAVLVTVS